MSEAAPERRTTTSPAGQGKGFSKKLAGVPVWVWAVGAAAAAGAFYLWRKNKKAAAAAQAGAALPSTGNAVDFSGQVATIQSEIQALQQGETGEGTRPPDKDKPWPVDKPPGRKPMTWTRHVTDGKKTLAQLAQQWNSSPAEMFTWLREAPAGTDDVRDFANWFNNPDQKLRGLIYYTPDRADTTSSQDAAFAQQSAADNTGSGSSGDISPSGIPDAGGGSVSVNVALPSGQATTQPAAPRTRPPVRSPARPRRHR